MRRALIGIFLAATMATPLAAQVEDEAARGDNVETREARSEAGSEARAERRAERQSRREARQPEFQAEAPRQEERAEERVERTQRNVSRREGVQRTLDRVFGSREPEELHEHGRNDRHDRRDHRETHREYRRDHDALHRRDPSPREHRRFHREVNRDHNRWHQRWDHNWRRDTRYDWQRYRYYNRDLYRVGRYYSPYRGYRYRPLSIGIRLGSDFYAHPYWINDPWRYRLPYAYAGSRWVRYYDDVVLVDLYSGQVIDVIYDFFW